MSYRYGGWAPYVPVAQRRAKAKKKMDALRKKGQVILPIEIKGNKIAKTFWGKAWCDHIEGFSDYSNRLPRGRTYARNGSVCHLEMKKGHIHAMVSGSELYTVNIEIKPLTKSRWATLKKACVGQIRSVLELLQGKISDQVMSVMTSDAQGLLPTAKQIEFRCTCPDDAYMCKHIAAVLYGVGARLDHSPQELFLLRGVDETELIEAELQLPKTTEQANALEGDLGSIFGIDLDVDGDSLVEPAVDQSVGLPKKTRKTKTKADNTKATSPTFRRKKTIKPIKPNSRQKKKTASTPPDHGINISRGIRASHIKRLCQYFDMTPNQFAKLIGKSPITVKSWLEKKGVLNLQMASQTSLEAAFRMNVAQGWQQYEQRD